jgi:hypothetical protein
VSSSHHNKVFQYSVILLHLTRSHLAFKKFTQFHQDTNSKEERNLVLKSNIKEGYSNSDFHFNAHLSHSLYNSSTHFHKKLKLPPSNLTLISGLLSKKIE